MKPIKCRGCGIELGDSLEEALGKGEKVALCHGQVRVVSVWVWFCGRCLDIIEEEISRPIRNLFGLGGQREEEPYEPNP